MDETSSKIKKYTAVTIGCTLTAGLTLLSLARVKPIVKVHAPNSHKIMRMATIQPERQLLRAATKSEHYYQDISTIPVINSWRTCKIMVLNSTDLRWDEHIWRVKGNAEHILSQFGSLIPCPTKARHVNILRADHNTCICSDFCRKKYKLTENITAFLYKLNIKGLVVQNSVLWKEFPTQNGPQGWQIRQNGFGIHCFCSDFKDPTAGNVVYSRVSFCS